MQSSCHTFSTVPLDEVLAGLRPVRGFDGKLRWAIDVGLQHANVRELVFIGLRRW